MICLVRHNGILYVLPIFLLIPFYTRRSIRYILITAVLSIICVIIVKVPVSQYLNVAPHENRTGEAMGIPMAIMANALICEPEKLPTEVHDFLTDIADDTAWKNHYITGEWDSCKWEFGGSSLLADVSPLKILNYTLMTIKACPDSSYQSVKANTRIVWEPLFSYGYWVPKVYITNNDYGIKATPIKPVTQLTELLIRISLSFPISILCWLNIISPLYEKLFLIFGLALV